MTAADLPELPEALREKVRAMFPCRCARSEPVGTLRPFVCHQCGEWLESESEGSLRGRVPIRCEWCERGIAVERLLREQEADWRRLVLNLSAEESSFDEEAGYNEFAELCLRLGLTVEDFGFRRKLGLEE